MPDDAVYKLKPSRRHALFLAVLLAVVVGMLLFMPWPWWLSGLFIVCTALYGYYAYQEIVCLKGCRAIHCLRRCDADLWELQTGEGIQRGELSKAAVVTRFVSVLSFKVPGRGRYGCMIFPDALPAGQYRAWLIGFTL